MSSKLLKKKVDSFSKGVEAAPQECYGAWFRNVSKSSNLLSGEDCKSTCECEGLFNFIPKQHVTFEFNKLCSKFGTSTSLTYRKLKGNDIKRDFIWSPRLLYTPYCTTFKTLGLHDENCTR